MSIDGSDTSFVDYVVTAVKSKGLKYSMVSVINVIVGQALLIGFQKLFNLTPTKANVLAVLVSAVPAYYLSRAWVWGRKGKSHFRKEVLPFWFFVGVGLVFSTLVVKGVHNVWDNTHPNGPEQPAIITNIANMFAFGILWVLRFFLFEKLFHTDPVHVHDPDPDEEPEEAVGTATAE